MLYYELEDGLYTAGPYFFAKVRAGSKCYRALHTLQQRKSFTETAMQSLEEFQRLTGHKTIHREARAVQQKWYC